MWESNVLSFFTLLWFLLHNNPTEPQTVLLEISGVFVWFIPDGTRHISFLLRIIFTLEQFNCIVPSKQKKSSAWEWICCNGIFRVFFSGLKGNLKKLHTISFIWIEYISFKKSSPYLNNNIFENYSQEKSNKKRHFNIKKVFFKDLWKIIIDVV